MFSAFQTFGRLGAGARAVAAAWSPLALWPDGISSAGMWISPRDLTSQWKDYTGTTPVVEPGTVADSSNPVGLALDIRAGATVLTDPGNHMRQATSTARPLLSARRNLLTYSEDFSNEVWQTTRTACTVTNVLSPDGSTTAGLMTADGTSSRHMIGQSGINPGGNAISVKALAGTARFLQILFDNVANAQVNFDLQLGTYSLGAGAVSASVTAAEDGYFLCTATCSGTPINAKFYIVTSLGAGRQEENTLSTYLTLWHPQLQFGASATTYQRVNTASDYTATGLPIAQLYDGTDDGMATAAFSAGTLIDGMDCLIAVRRDSGANATLVSDAANECFGVFANGAEYLNCSGAGTPTVWVDGVQLAGGVYVTAGTLDAALTVGDWHIVEFRGLDLSLWESIGFSNYTGLRLNGPRGDILLYPSTASTEDKDAARQYLADYYGVTLP